jgi:hypothetical protein
MPKDIINWIKNHKTESYIAVIFIVSLYIAVFGLQYLNKGYISWHFVVEVVVATSLFIVFAGISLILAIVSD